MMIPLLACAVLVPQSKFPYQDPTLAAEVRARDLVGRLTVDEKIRQLSMEAPGIPRLNIPPYHWWNEALHGVARAGYATVFPQAIGLAATWDTELMHQVSTTISTEARAKYREAQARQDYSIYHGLTLWSPNINIFRDPRWGRGQETYGEDPFLTSRMGVAFVTGIQGDDRKYLRAVATPKHFAVHSGPEPLRHHFDAKTPERDLFETYLPAFEATVREGHAQSVMSAYSGFNGKPATGNPWLLTELLRKTWGFDGAVVSDVDSVGDLWQGHRVAKDAAEASAMALRAGNDLCSGWTYSGLPEALRRKLVTEQDIDLAATRLFTLRMRLGMFDSPKEVAYQQIPANAYDTPAHDAVALKAAAKSLVLLKNDGVLPIQPKRVRRVAVIGPVAEDSDILIGNYAGTPSRPTTLLAGITKHFKAAGIDVDYAKGCALAAGLPPDFDPFDPATIFTDASRTSPGFQREVFANTTLSGTPVSVGNDAGQAMRWGRDDAPMGLPGQNMSIRWKGVWVPKESGTIQFGAAYDDGARVWVNDQLIINDWRSGGERSKSGSFTAEAGKPVSIRVEYYQAGGEASIRFGVVSPSQLEERRKAAVAMAAKADLVILTLGITPNLEGEEMNVSAEGFSGGDRQTLDLPKPQRELLEAITGAGKPVVLVLTGGSALAFDPKLANAALLTWYPGQRGGDAVAQALLGQVNPAGRLPVTFYKSVADLPAFDDYAMKGRTYRYFPGSVLFPFGHGLSYGKFAYEKATGRATTSGAVVSVTLRNASQHASEEVVQVYAVPTQRRPDDALKSLVAFRRLVFTPGQRRTVTLEIPRTALRTWDPVGHRYIVRPGEYRFMVGASSTDVRSTVQVRLP